MPFFKLQCIVLHKWFQITFHANLSLTHSTEDSNLLYMEVDKGHQFIREK